MKIIVAPDSYKGSLSAAEVAVAMEKGIHAVFPDAQVIRIPAADGGEGTVEAFLAAVGGEKRYCTVQDPLGRNRQAYWGLLPGKAVGVVEMAAASGLTLLSPEERDPRITTSYGTGQLLQAALNWGVKKIIVGIGGSATNDGGAGMLQALGARLLDDRGGELAPGGAALANLAEMDVSRLDVRLQETEIIVACDVNNPLCGLQGASFVYGRQKGATNHAMEELDAALAHYAHVAAAVSGRDVAQTPGAGAAGGLGAAFLYFTNAVLRPGIDIMLEAVRFDEIVQNACFVITGEGLSDRQTLHGKVPVGMAKAAQKFGIPVVCLSGGLGEGHETMLSAGIAAVQSIAPGPISLAACMQQASQLIEQATMRMCRLIHVGMESKQMKKQ